MGSVTGSVRCGDVSKRGEQKLERGQTLLAIDHFVSLDLFPERFHLGNDHRPHKVGHQRCTISNHPIICPSNVTP